MTELLASEEDKEEGLWPHPSSLHSWHYRGRTLLPQGTACLIYLPILHISPCTLAPPGSAIQEPLAKGNLSTQGVMGTLSTGAQGVPYKLTSLLTSQEQLLHLFTTGTALSCGPHATIIVDDSSGTVFHVPRAVHFTNVLSSIKGHELCLQYMNPAGQ